MFRTLWHEPMCPPTFIIGTKIGWVNQHVSRELVLTFHWLQDKNPRRMLVLAKNLV